MILLNLNDLTIVKDCNVLEESRSPPQGTAPRDIIMLQLNQHKYVVRPFSMRGSRAILDGLTPQCYCTMSAEQRLFLEWNLSYLGEFETVQLNFVYRGNSFNQKIPPGFYYDHLWFCKDNDKPLSGSRSEIHIGQEEVTALVEGAFFRDLAFPNTTTSGLTSIMEIIDEHKPMLTNENLYIDFVYDDYDKSKILAYGVGSYLSRDKISPIFGWTRPDYRGKSLIARVLKVQNSLSMRVNDYCALNNTSSLKVLLKQGYKLHGITISKQI